MSNPKVKILTGKFSGEVGEVLAVNADSNQVQVQTSGGAFWYSQASVEDTDGATVQWNVGDMVQVLSGEYGNARGYIKAVDDVIRLVKVEINGQELVDFEFGNIRLVYSEEEAA